MPPECSLEAAQAGTASRHYGEARGAAVGAVGWAVLVFAFSWAVGWVVRGLLGVERGADHKQ